MTGSVNPQSATPVSCHICGAAGGSTITGYESFRRVTSDCRPWPNGGKLWVCGTCGCVQKIVDEQWRLEVSQIYESYSIYHQAAGAEQLVFAGGEALATSRSARLLEHLLAQRGMTDSGRLLDIGCGNGAFLKAFARSAPGWRLFGNELNDKYRRQVEAIPGVQKLFTCPVSQVPGTYDIISAIHVLEHVPGPANWLAELLPKFESTGYVVIEVPDHTRNPFDLLIADHCTHFCETTIRRVMETAGFEIAVATADWIPKELSVIARTSTVGTVSPPRPVLPKGAARRDRDTTPTSPEKEAKVASENIRWLEKVLAAARSLSKSKQFGVFGTSIAATWLSAELDEQVSFFVDEDPSRVGRQFFGRPVYHPRDAPAGSRVFVALAPMIAERVMRRLAQDWPACEFVSESA